MEGIDPQAPGPMTRYEYARHSGKPLSLIKQLTDEVYETFPECFEESDRGLILTVEAQQLTEELMPPEEGWFSADTIAELLDSKPETVIAAARRLSSEGSSHEGCLLRRRPEDEPIGLFMSADLANDVSTTIRNRQTRAAQREQEREVGERFTTFADDMKAGESLDAQEFRKLVEIFGPDSGMDLLIQYRPEFKSAPVDMVSSFLSDYLGSLLIVKGKLDLDHLTLTSEFLSNQSLKRTLTEVVKKHCISYYQQYKRDNPNEDDLSILSDHLQDLRETISDMENDDLLGVLEAVEDYFTFLFVAIEKPAAFISSLTGDRPFPDLNQRVNVGELIYKDEENAIFPKRRLLIADDPGMGKSASAIMSKEFVGAKCAVILSPSGMVDTWKGYLRDYFQEGQQPRVLVLDSPHKLNEVSTDDYDYIILSHGRLTPEYTNALMKMGFDMLIVDEAHEFKNIQEGKKAAELIRLSDYVSEQPDTYTIMLTATPAPNKVSDIAMMLRILCPGSIRDPETGEPLDNKALTLRIINGDYIDLRTLLVPRMQRKLIEESIKMPGLIEEVVELQLSPKMQEIYELYLEEDELDSSEKIRRIRQFLNNPATLDSTPDVESVKAVCVGEALNEHFKTEDKILMFVNDYVDNIITGEHTIQGSFNLPENVEVCTLTGESEQALRSAAHQAFQTKDGKMLLIVSGNIAGLGIDLSAADRVVFYNHPWNKSLRRQQVGRAYRPGREKPLYVESFYFPNTLEEGLELYTAAKEVAIQKLMNGIQLSELEKEALMHEEQDSGVDETLFDITPELAAYYYSSWQRMLRMFGHVKEIGEEDFVQKFLPDHGVEYAKTYRELSNRSYQANAARLAGTMIADHFDDRKMSPKDVRIIDVASGPEMLRAHIPEPFTNSVTSLDINASHFNEPGGKRMVGSMLHLPIASSTADCVNLSLAIHYSKQRIKQGVFERAETLAEINRVLKPKGRAMITMLYSLDFEDNEKLADSLDALGFRIVKRSSGEVTSGDIFKVKLLTIEKIRNVTDLASASNARMQSISSGLKFAKTTDRLKDTRKIAEEFWIKGQRKVQARLTRQDHEILEEESDILSRMQALKQQHGDIREIPPEEVILNGFSRIFNGKKHILFSRLRSAIGSVILR